MDPFVQDKFRELWREARKRYVAIWRNKWLTAEAQSIEDMINGLRAAAGRLDQMRKDGIVLEDKGRVREDDVHLVTTDPKVAEKYGMIDESEYWETDAEDDDAAAGSGTANAGPGDE